MAEIVPTEPLDADGSSCGFDLVLLHALRTVGKFAGCVRTGKDPVLIAGKTRFVPSTGAGLQRPPDPEGQPRGCLSGLHIIDMAVHWVLSTMVACSSRATRSGLRFLRSAGFGGQADIVSAESSK